MMRRHTLLVVGALMLLAAVPAFATHSWNGYHWARTANPFTLKLGNNVDSTWIAHLQQTSSDWNTNRTTFPTVVQTTIVPGSSNKRCSAVSGTTQVCNGKYGNNGWLGLASIWLQSGTSHITQGTSKMNDTYFLTPTYDNPNEREHVMCQEVAHTFGLDHQSTDGSSLNTCMDYFSNTGADATNPASTTPNAHDFEELSIIYQHLDSTTTVALLPWGNSAASMAGAPDDGIDWNNPAEWGHVIDATVNGNTTTYERELANGDKVITYVIWAREYDGARERGKIAQ